MPYSLVLDVLVAFLLVVTIGYAVVLNRRLGVLRSDKAELEKLALSFGEATLRAEESLGQLRQTAEDLQQRIEKAQSLADDLVFLVDRGGTAADRLEELVREARKETGVPTPVAAEVKAEARPERPATRAARGGETRAAAQPAGEDNEFEPRSEAERELLRALQSVR